MLASQRQQFILEHVLRAGGARVSELVEELDVSDMTIRRDIGALERQGLLSRVHGGVTTLPGRTAEEPGFAAKSVIQLAEKEAIGACAAQLVQAGDAIAVSAGTTTHALARAVRDVPNLTVVTNSLAVSDEMHAVGRVDRRVLLTGGIRTPSDALVGPMAVGALRDLHVDWLFLGVHGMDPDAGLTTPNLEEVDTDRALIASAKRVVLLADHTKWRLVALAAIISLSEVDILISDSGLPDEARDELRSYVSDVRVVELDATIDSAQAGSGATG